MAFEEPRRGGCLYGGHGKIVHPVQGVAPAGVKLYLRDKTRRDRGKSEKMHSLRLACGAGFRVGV